VATMTDLRPHDRLVKHLLRKGRGVDPFFVGKFSFSPYQACAHGCRYCDGRAERYWVEGVFDQDIIVRRNAAEVLGREVRALRERGVVFVGSGISDAYQPIETDARLMEACGRVLLDHDLPVTILTKSSLIARDLELWAQVNGTRGFLLMMSLVTLDDEVRRRMEPGASPVEERIETLRAFKQRGCATGVAAMPLLPFLGDGEAELEALAGRLAGLGVDFVLPGGLTLRPGRQKEAFFETLRASFPELVSRYEWLYAENRESGAPRRDYADAARQRAASAFARAGLPTVVPHRVYRDRVPLYDEVDVLLQHMAMLYTPRVGSSAVRRLDASRQRYHRWLVEQESQLNRRRSLREEDVARSLEALVASDEWPTFLGSEKLARFLRDVVLERRVFDERTLTLGPPVTSHHGA
jgi:DNA repair photolyase